MGASDSTNITYPEDYSSRSAYMFRPTFLQEVLEICCEANNKIDLTLLKHEWKEFPSSYSFAKTPISWFQNVNDNYTPTALEIITVVSMILPYKYGALQQYRECGFKKYTELISCLLVVEHNNELLMKNHELRPTGSVPLSETNGTVLPEANAKSRRGRGRGRAASVNVKSNVKLEERSVDSRGWSNDSSEDEASKRGDVIASSRNH
ncbi:uncharacterized protein LOC111394025 [Olea europaea var. sylvestris]|uniref:uncharacterized protein LOC111394025 n=1 Tax=Olea europaea var. sylvestris TaxID=158386 RepID=UPI000C1CCE31|nr:uncharacterized protein LOC111394025 [Olea europaea var. sylvestris]